MDNLIQIDIEEAQLETRNKRAGGTYQIQSAYAHLLDSNGNPERYPRKIHLFPPRDQQGNSVPYQPGKYTLSPSSFRVGNGAFLEIGFVNLVPLTTGKASK
jgi:hypothetical protein